MTDQDTAPKGREALIHALENLLMFGTSDKGARQHAYATLQAALRDSPTAQVEQEKRWRLVCGCAMIDDFVMYPCRYHAYLIRDRDAAIARNREQVARELVDEWLAIPAEERFSHSSALRDAFRERLQGHEQLVNILKSAKIFENDGDWTLVLGIYGEGAKAVRNLLMEGR